MKLITMMMLVLGLSGCMACEQTTGSVGADEVECKYVFGSCPADYNKVDSCP